MTKLNKSKINKAISELKFDPNTPAFSILIETGNENYYRTRVEYLLKSGDTNYLYLIQLLLLAKLDSEG